LAGVDRRAAFVSGSGEPPPTDGAAAVRRGSRRELPRRFYAEAKAEPHGDAYALKLDGRLAMTPAKRPLAVASRPVANALAGEWASQGERIDSASMPITRIVNSAIDGVAAEMPAVRAEIVSHAASDLLCYRADAPPGLVEAQDAAWSPLLAWAKEALGARFILAEGVMPVKQDGETLAAIARAIEGFGPLALAALHTITTLTGSAIVALALARGRITPDEAWAVAHVDEDWQMKQWGTDAAAASRRSARRREFDAAATILAALRQ
jgi:chaperone required for assembly of F1-ATPase